MTTVGYGDMYPITSLGQVVTAFFMIFCLVITALPVAIIGGNFTVYYEYSIKRENKKQRKEEKQEEKQEESMIVPSTECTSIHSDDISDCIEL